MLQRSCSSQEVIGDKCDAVWIYIAISGDRGNAPHRAGQKRRIFIMLLRHANASGTSK